MHTTEQNIAGHRDFEFYSNYNRSIKYTLTVPETPTGLVIYIAGFGDDAGSYQANFRKHIHDKYSMACLCVDYHCFFSRPSNGGTLSIDPPVMNMLRSLTGYINQEPVDSVLEKASQLRLNPQIPLHIPGTIIPAKQEYQNFGLLAALDHIYALNDALKKNPEIPKKIYAIGSSYGGYIANLISKFAPCTLNALFDNSSWASPNQRYTVGHILGHAEFSYQLSPNIILDLNVLSPWSPYHFMPNAFSNSRTLIRSFPDAHIEIMKEVGGCKTFYKFIHSNNDLIANTNEKKSMASLMKEKGFKVDMDIYSEVDIDGSYIKNMSHGMGLSMQQFFAKSLKKANDQITDDQRTDFDFDHSFQFVCDNLIYSITYQQGDPVLLSIKEQNLG